MTIGKLIEEWILLSKNSLISITFEAYVKTFGSYNDNREFNNLKNSLIEVEKSGE